MSHSWAQASSQKETTWAVIPMRISEVTVRVMLLAIKLVISFSEIPNKTDYNGDFHQYTIPHIYISHVIHTDTCMNVLHTKYTNIRGLVISFVLHSCFFITTTLLNCRVTNRLPRRPLA